MSKIKSVNCHKILNSRGDWTIETAVELEDGSIGTQAVPEGASKGEKEAVSISVDRAVPIVNEVINEALKGQDSSNQKEIDNILIEMDGTENKSHLGGNSILSASLAVAKATSISMKLELYEYLSIFYSGKQVQRSNLVFPTPVFNILNGGKHANNELSFQEFMIIPSQDLEFDKKMEMGVRVYDSLKEALEKDGFETGVGDEGGFAPDGFTSKKAYEYIRNAAKSDYSFGKDIFVGMDAASDSFYFDEIYEIKEESLKLDANQLGDYYLNLAKEFPLMYLEDPFVESDSRAWIDFYPKIGDKLMLVGDDLVVTNSKYLEKAISEKMINAVIVKPNQVGTLSETIAFIQMAKKSNLSIIVSHRSGDTAEDTFISDLALAVGAEFIKSGAPVRGERVAKYNRLLDVYYS